MKRQILFSYLQLFRCLPADVLLFITDKKKLIKSDLERILVEIPYDKASVGAFNYALIFVKNFRNIFYYRTSNSRILRILSRFFLPQLDSLEIHGDIGEGFRIYHNYGVIHPYKAGRNFTVHHGVTIGKGRSADRGSQIVDPVFGDNVEIMSGAIVFGGIKIGNNVTIGAGSVVNKDVPDNCKVIGNPMRIISVDK